MNRIIPSLSRALSLFLPALMLSLPATAQDNLSIMLDWFVNPDHGPIIVAQQRGYFAETGLAVSIINFSLTPARVAGQVDAVSGAFRHWAKPSQAW